MIEKIIELMIDEKIGQKDYEEFSEHFEDSEVKAMLMKISQDEHNHYKMLKELLSRYIDMEKEDE